VVKKVIFLNLLIFLINCASSEVFIKPNTNFKKYKRVAIYNFLDYPIIPNSGRQLADILSMNLLGSNIDLVDRSSTETIMKEWKISLSGIIDEKTTPEIGNLLGVQAILLGSVNEWGSVTQNIQIVQGSPPAYMTVSSVGITVKLIDCETAEIIWAANARGTEVGPNQHTSAANKAVKDLVKKLNKSF